jgi:hypothetical protein
VRGRLGEWVKGRGGEGERRLFYEGTQYSLTSKPFSKTRIIKLIKKTLTLYKRKKDNEFTC